MTLMAFVTPWSILLALADAYSLLLEQLPHKPSVLSIVLAGDVVLSFLSLGGACGVASATELLLSTGAQICGDNFCSQYRATATLVFLCWLLLLASALFNLWSLLYVM
ncbi:CASP-like protein 5C2 [Raphanus sativus]|nr:CASP-like protein 5C2 [Raphanus sativus]